MEKNNQHQKSKRKRYLKGYFAGTAKTLPISEIIHVSARH